MPDLDQWSGVTWVYSLNLVERFIIISFLFASRSSSGSSRALPIHHHHSLPLCLSPWPQFIMSLVLLTPHTSQHCPPALDVEKWLNSSIQKKWPHETTTLTHTLTLAFMRYTVYSIQWSVNLKIVNCCTWFMSPSNTLQWSLIFLRIVKGSV